MMLKIVFYGLAACLLTGPILAWAYLFALACGYRIGSGGCGFQRADFWDVEFLSFAVLPWMLGVFCLFMGLKRR